jgi:REP element-mobilizing transposase RayT
MATIEEACAKTRWQVHAFCLMNNHFHLVVETPEPNLVAGMKWLLGTYTGRFNRRHKMVGHLFSGRYRAQIVDGSGTGYLKTVCDYVHLNPVRAKLIRQEQPLRAYAWSSWPEYLKVPSQRPAWLRVDRLLGEYGIPQDSAAVRRRMEDALEARRGGEEDNGFQAVRRGWYLGDEAFRKELLARMNDRIGQEHYGEERLEMDRDKAERIISEELKRLRWTESELGKRVRGDTAKVEITARLRSETPVTVKWIAGRLRMGSPGYVHHLLYLRRKAGKGSDLSMGSCSV